MTTNNTWLPIDDPERPAPRDGTEMVWKPIDVRPDVGPGGHSRRFLGITAGGSYVFCHYTPAYLGAAAESSMLWVCEGYGFATKPTHYMPLPPPPET